MVLTTEKCTACRADAPKVTRQEILELQPTIPEWEIKEEADIERLTRAFSFPDFSDALSFAMGVGNIAEEEGHHPRLTVEWGQVTVEWWTHKIRGLHRNDFIMAAKTDWTHAQP